MNSWCGVGRTTKETEVNTSGKVATNSIAIDRPFKDANGNKATDFINLKFLGEKRAEHARKYLTKGMKIAVEGSLNIDNYKDRDGNSRQAVYINVSNWEFAESKGNNSSNQSAPQTSSDGFMNIPDGLENDNLPFN